MTKQITLVGSSYSPTVQLECKRQFCFLIYLRRQIRHVKLHSHMRGAVAERRRADFDIPAPLPRVCSHTRGADAGGSALSWGQWWFGARGFEAGAVNWVLDPFLAERFLLPLHLRSATAHVWTHVMICVEANVPPAAARVHPRMCERTFNVIQKVISICIPYTQTT